MESTYIKTGSTTCTQYIVWLRADIALTRSLPAYLDTSYGYSPQGLSRLDADSLQRISMSSCWLFVAIRVIMHCLPVLAPYLWIPRGKRIGQWTFQSNSHHQVSDCKREWSAGAVDVSSSSLSLDSWQMEAWRPLSRYRFVGCSIGIRMQGL